MAQKRESLPKPVDSLKNLSLSFINYKDLGKKYRKTANYKLAIFYYNKANDLKKDKEVQKQLADLWLAKGYPEKAVSLLEEILKKDSTDKSSMFMLAKLYASLHKNTKAIKLLKKLEKEDPGNSWYTYQRAKLINDDIKDKLNTFLLSYRKDSTWLKPIYAIAQIYYKMKLHDSAEYFIQKGLKLRPRHSGLLSMKVREDFRKKKYHSMLHTLESMDSLQIKPFFTHKMLGINYYLLKKHSLSLKYLDKAIEINSDDPDLYLYKAYSLGALKKFNEAESMLKIAIKLKHPPIDKEYFHMGLMAQNKRQYKKALDYFYLAYTENPKNTKALFFWALNSDLYYKDKNIALKRYKKYLAIPLKKKENEKIAKERIKELQIKLFMKKK